MTLRCHYILTKTAKLQVLDVTINNRKSYLLLVEI